MRRRSQCCDILYPSLAKFARAGPWRDQSMRADERVFENLGNGLGHAPRRERFRQSARLLTRTSGERLDDFLSKQIERAVRKFYLTESILDVVKELGVDKQHGDQYDLGLCSTAARFGRRDVAMSGGRERISRPVSTFSRTQRLPGTVAECPNEMRPYAWIGNGGSTFAEALLGGRTLFWG